MPGDWLIWVTLTYVSPVARFFGVDAGDYGGVLSGVVSAVVWCLGAKLVVSTFGATRDFDHALTRSLIRKYGETRRRMRVGVALLGYWLRRGFQRQRPDHEAIEFPEELELNDRELHVLRLHFELMPGYALTLSDVAAALGLGRNETRGVLERLLRLRLLAATLGGGDGENSYALTRAGRAFLSFHASRSLEEETQSLPVCASLD